MTLCPRRFSYLGESRGWPQTSKARGVVADAAGFWKESADWVRAWWLANIDGETDAGRPSVDPELKYVASIPETWEPAQGQSAGKSTRVIHAYTNAASVSLLVNGKEPAGGNKQAMAYFGTATFDAIPYEAGNLTAVAYDGSGAVVATATRLSHDAPSGLRLVVDAPSPATGTGTALVSDGEDVAMLRAEIVDGRGNLVPVSGVHLVFEVATGHGRVLASHSGSPSDQGAAWSNATMSYYGLGRCFVRSTLDASSEHRARQLLLAVHPTREAAGARIAVPGSPEDMEVLAGDASILVRVSSPGLG